MSAPLLQVNSVRAYGLPGGQTARGGTAASESLTLRGTKHATTGPVKINDLGGDVVLGAGLLTTDIKGHVYVPSCNGVPTGVPVGYSSLVAMGYDRAASKLYFYNGGWNVVGTGTLTGDGVATYIPYYSAAQVFTNSAGLTYTATGLAINNAGIAAARQLEVVDTAAPQLRLTHTAGVVYGDFGIDASGNISIVSFGAGFSTNVGRSSSAAGSGGTAMGYFSSAAATNNGTAYGYGCAAGGDYSLAMGSGSNTSAAYSQAFGYACTVTAVDCIAFGANCAGNEAGSVIFGGTTAYSNIYAGLGRLNAAPVAWTLNGTGGSGTNIAGGALNIAGGLGTGSGTPGVVNIQCGVLLGSGTTLQTRTTVATFSSGGLLLGTSGSAARRLEVIDASAAQFRLTYTAASAYADYFVNSLGSLQITLSTNARSVGIGNPVALESYSVAIGAGSVGGPGDGNTAIGYLANGLGGLAIGRQANSSGGASSTAIGPFSATSGDEGIAIGNTANAAYRALAIGNSAVAAADCFAFGRSATTSGLANACVMGSSLSPINDFYSGKGATHATPTAWTLNGTGGSGTDIAGGGLDICGGRGTGAGIGGSVRVRTTPAGATGTTLRTLATLFEVTGDAKIGLYGVTPVVRAAAYTQTYATADRTITDVAADYTGIDNLQVGTVYATVADLNALKLKLQTTLKHINALVDDSQGIGISA